MKYVVEFLPWPDQPGMPRELEPVIRLELTLEAGSQDAAEAAADELVGDNMLPSRLFYMNSATEVG